MKSGDAVVPKSSDTRVKVVIVGEAGVGKTSLLVRFVKDTFDEIGRPTLGVDFLTKDVISAATGRPLQLNLWDTAGHEAFRSVTRGYYRGASAAVVVFDLGKRDSFEKARRWLADVRDCAHPNVVAMLIGNKADDLRARTIHKEEAEAFAANDQMLYWETSARTGAGVREAFGELIRAVEGRIGQAEAFAGVEAGRVEIQDVAPPAQGRACC